MGLLEKGATDSLLKCVKMTLILREYMYLSMPIRQYCQLIQSRDQGDLLMSSTIFDWENALSISLFKYVHYLCKNARGKCHVQRRARESNARQQKRFSLQERSGATQRNTRQHVALRWTNRNTQNEHTVGRSAMLRCVASRCSYGNLALYSA